MLRTLQRKASRWRALFGKDREVIFRQINEPGKLGVSDFTHPKDIQVTINGEFFEHIFYHFRLAFSGFNFIKVYKGSGESFTAFAEGLQEALQRLGGVPETHRTDSLSAAFKNLSKEAQEDLTERYRAFSEHYGMKATRINPGKGHENGTIESSHRHVKDRIRQNLIVRGNIDFDSHEHYQSFIDEVIKDHNHHSAKLIEIERKALRSLPLTKAIDYTEAVAVVSSSSTIQISRVTYTVPSRLIGERLLVRVYNEKLECYLGSAHALSLVRAKNPARGKKAHVVDYRHVIGSLSKKPGAFRSYQLRDALLPDDQYRFIWQHVDKTMNGMDACKFIVGLLHLAAKHDCQNELVDVVIELIKSRKQLKLSELQDRFSLSKVAVPAFNVQQHLLSSYNDLIPNYQGRQ